MIVVCTRGVTRGVKEVAGRGGGGGVKAATLKTMARARCGRETARNCRATCP